MNMTKKRFDELGLGCASADCDEYNCGECGGCKPYEVAPCVDEDRVRGEMTEEEYDAFRHNRLTVVDEETGEETASVGVSAESLATCLNAVVDVLIDLVEEGEALKRLIEAGLSDEELVGVIGFPQEEVDDMRTAQPEEEACD